MAQRANLRHHHGMQTLNQSPTEAGFVQDPYPFYAQARAAGPLAYWTDYKMPMATTYEAVNTLLRDRRFGREPVTPLDIPAHLAPFYAVEAHSMLELEPPRHTRLRRLVLRAFTTRRIQALGPEITALAHAQIDAFAAADPGAPFDLLDAYCRPIPVIVIARLLGVPEEMAGDLLRWSNAMVMMYQAGRSRAQEDAAVAATQDFVDFMRAYVDKRRSAPRDDLISHLIAAEEDGDTLSTDELITTCILLLNAGHEATVHSMGNGIKLALERGLRPDESTATDGQIEELLRVDPPLHLFTRHCYEDVSLFGHNFRRGDEVGLLLASANHDASVYPDPTAINPTRRGPANAAFGAGLHFCVGAPLARLELQIALPVLFARCPKLRLADAPQYAPIYHFHGLEHLMVHSDRTNII